MLAYREARPCDSHKSMQAIGTCADLSAQTQRNRREREEAPSDAPFLAAPRLARRPASPAEGIASTASSFTDGLKQHAPMATNDLWTNLGSSRQTRRCALHLTTTAARVLQLARPPCDRCCAGRGVEVEPRNATRGNSNQVAPSP